MTARSQILLFMKSKPKKTKKTEKQTNNHQKNTDLNAFTGMPNLQLVSSPNETENVFVLVLHNFFLQTFMIFRAIIVIITTWYQR